MTQSSETNTTIQVYVKRTSNNVNLPIYASDNASGLDLYAYIQDSIILKPQERKLIPTGIAIDIPKHYEAQIRPRSGLAYHYGITLLNSPGTIDSDYRGEIKVLLINLGLEPYSIEPNTRIAQMVFAKVEQAHLIEVQSLSQSKRAENGFGSTGYTALNSN